MNKDNHLSERFEAISVRLKELQGIVVNCKTANEAKEYSREMTNLLQECELLKEKLRKLMAENGIIVGDYWVNNVTLSIVTVEHITPEGEVELSFANNKSVKTHRDALVMFYTKLDNWIEINGYKKEY